MNIFNKRSKLLFVLASLETIAAVYFLSYFNYLDRLSYMESINNTTQDLALLLQNMFTSTWWGLLILVICFISIFSIISLIYRDEKYQLISCFLWIILLILSINLKDSLTNNISNLCIFLPIIIINFIAFRNQKNILNK